MNIIIKERYLTMTLPKINYTFSEYIHDFLYKLHSYLIQTKKIASRYKHFYMQGESEEEALEHEMPEQYTQFEKMVHEFSDFLPDDTQFVLGLWNGMFEFADGCSFHFHFSNDASEKPFFDHRAEASFHFPLLQDESDHTITQEISQLVPLAFELLPCSFITEYDFNYISQYNGTPDLIVGAALYGRKTDLAGVEGVRRDITDELVVLSPVVGPFDSGNPEHVKKAHDWEKYLLRAPEFRQLLLR